MATKPMLFNAEMTRAVRERRKTVTRRVVKPQPPEHTYLQRTHGKFAWSFWEDGDKHWTRAPYQPGDILYVRETFFEYKGNYYYKADGKHLSLNSCFGGKEFFKWRPSIHMPREAARIFLRVTDVRVERLRDITTEQIKAEGISEDDITERDAIHQEVAARWLYEKLWDSTIEPADREKYGWGANPWVWVIEFERVSKEAAGGDA